MSRLRGRIDRLAATVGALQAGATDRAEVLAFGRYYVGAGIITLQAIPNQPEALSLVVDAAGMTEAERHQAYANCYRLQDMLSDHLEAADLPRPTDQVQLLALLRSL